MLSKCPSGYLSQEFQHLADKAMGALATKVIIDRGTIGASLVPMEYVVLEIYNLEAGSHL